MNSAILTVFSTNACSFWEHKDATLRSQRQVLLMPPADPVASPYQPASFELPLPLQRPQ